MAPEVSVKIPLIVRLAPKTRLTVDVLKVTAEQTAPLAVVHVPVPDALSKNTASALVGADAPLAPPDAVDQLAVELASQVPVPPTQYLLAISV